MFSNKKTLIVVYKDELLMNQLKKLIETNDDKEDAVVGTKDNTIDIVSWTEKVWLGEKAKGTIKGKVLFLGDIKGTDKLTPVIDIKFNEHGVKYGWAGNQAVVFAEPKFLTKREEYDAFLRDLANLPVPEILKVDKERYASGNLEQENSDSSLNDLSTNECSEVYDSEMDKPARKNGIIDAVVHVLSSGEAALNKAGSDLALKTEELFRDKKLMKRQMMFYGVIKLYQNDLTDFVCG